MAVYASHNMFQLVHARLQCDRRDRLFFFSDPVFLSVIVIGAPTVSGLLLKPVIGALTFYIFRSSATDLVLHFNMLSYLMPTQTLWQANYLYHRKVSSKSRVSFIC